MQYEVWALWAAVAAYVAAGSLAIVGTTFSRRLERVILAMLAAGLLLHALAIGLRWERVGHGPFTTMYEILLSNVWSLTLVFTLAYGRVQALRPAAAVVMPILFLMMGWLLLTDPNAGHLPPTYHTPWLYVHLTFGKIFLGATLVGVGLAGVILLRRWNCARFAMMPDSVKLDDLAYRFMALALVFETLMLIAGAIWAQDAWGRYWSWDPLETWAFLTWLTLAFAMHLRVTLKLAPVLGATMIWLVFILAFLTFFGVPFVSVAPHKGAV